MSADFTARHCPPRVVADVTRPISPPTWLEGGRRYPFRVRHIAAPELSSIYGSTLGPNLQAALRLHRDPASPPPPGSDFNELAYHGVQETVRVQTTATVQREIQTLWINGTRGG